jgi:hypothetical protein
MKLPRQLQRILRIAGLIALSLLLLASYLWAIGALWYDGLGKTFAIIQAVALPIALYLLKPRRKKIILFSAWFAVILIAWLCLRPSNQGDWQPDVAQLAHAEIDGDIVTLHNVRDCDYRSVTDYDTHWKTRTVRLSQITGIDLFVCTWGSPYMAHPIASFQFADAPPICFSIETRKKNGQSYSAIGGLYRQYTLIYTVAEEKDLVRLRTNFRSNQDCYLYRLNITPQHARERFLEYIKAMNRLHDHPRWYNAITTNCTTAIRQQRNAAKRLPFDWRMLVNGKGDEMLYERRFIHTGNLAFPELKRRSRINDAAHACENLDLFSQEIRKGLP